MWYLYDQDLDREIWDRVFIYTRDLVSYFKPRDEYAFRADLIRAGECPGCAPRPNKRCYLG